jgi:hypothetical protein
MVVVLGVPGCSQIFGLEPPTHGGATDAAGTDVDPPGRTDAHSDGAIELDTDGDGITDRDDNCPTVPNTSQFDEEKDGVGDVCDKCPISTNNADGDGDGVGDACDPNPQTGGEVLKLFEGFHAVPQTWTLDGGSWTQGPGDTLLGTATSGNQAGIYLPAAYSAHETVTTSATMTNALGTGYRIMAIKDDAAIGGFAVVCSTMIDSGTNTLYNNVYNQPAGTYYQRAAFNWSLNTPVIIKSVREDTDFDCIEAQGSTSATTMAFETTNTNNARIGLHIQSSVTRFDWLMVVTSP